MNPSTLVPVHQTTAQKLTEHLHGRWYGQYGAAPCPVCQPEHNRTQNALTLSVGRNGNLILHCKKSACTFTDVLAAAGVLPGDYVPPDPALMAFREQERLKRSASMADAARRLRDETRPVHGTLAESYLRGRGISCDLPSTLRFLPSAMHKPSNMRWPCLVSLVAGGNGFAIHRTFISRDGKGKAPVAPQKMMLGTTAGGAVRLSAGGSRLVVCEGIETGLSLLCGLLEGPASVWAALSTSGMRGLRLPPEPGRLVVALDGDRPGREAGHALALRAHAAGWDVGMIDPGDGRDFNDVLQEKGAA